MKKLIIIDGNALIHRAYHALPPLKTKKGRIVNAVYGFTSILLKVVSELRPDYLVATFDLEGPTFRDKEYAEYKAKRVKADQGLYDQIPLVKDLVRSFDIPIYEQQGFEADDVIGTITTKTKDVKNIIVTGDLDVLQLVSPSTEIYFLKGGISKAAIYDSKAVQARYGFLPKQVVDYKALKGDPSDNIPGVPGIGEKTAIELVKQFGSLKKLYEKIEASALNPKLKARVLEHRDLAAMSYGLAKIRLDVPLDFRLAKARWKFDKKKVISFLEKLEFKTLIKRIANL